MRADAWAPCTLGLVYDLVFCGPLSCKDHAAALQRGQLHEARDRGTQRLVARECLVWIDRVDGRDIVGERLAHPPVVAAQEVEPRLWAMRNNQGRNAGISSISERV